jgi:hypothetical protein
MTSEAQIAANRRNALLSTGPKGRNGKDISRENALRHGLRARQVVALAEDSADFVAYHADLAAALSPQDAFEAALVRRLALLSWRLDRLCRIEAAYLNADADYKAAHRGERRGDHNWPDQMPDFARYEAALDRGFRRTLLMLERRQAGRSAAAPAAEAAPVLASQKILFLPNEANLPAAESKGSGAETR